MDAAAGRLRLVGYGFLRRFAGSIALGGTGLLVQEAYVVSSRTIRLTLNNGNLESVQALVVDTYSGDVIP